MPRSVREESRKGSESKRAYVLDTSALLLGFGEVENLYTTEQAIEEVVYGELQVARLEAMLDSGIIKKITPRQETLKFIESLSKQRRARLSETDLSILAAAMDLSEKFEEIYIVTDDYQVQNLAIKLGLKFIPLKHPGISEE